MTCNEFSRNLRKSPRESDQQTRLAMLAHFNKCGLCNSMVNEGVARQAHEEGMSVRDYIDGPVDDELIDIVEADQKKLREETES